VTATATGPVTEVLARATTCQPVRPDDARAGADYLRVVADGQAYFVKRLSPATDWIMRVTGDHVHRPYLVWRAGIMNKAPRCIDHTVVAMEVAGTGDDATLSMLMRDVGACLVPPGDAQVPLAQHDGFLTHMAELAASFWGIASLVHDRPDVVAGPLARTPPTFLQGDWKMGNLGSHPDGRTILLDWAYPGSGPACWDLCWYLALNRARLPEPKEAAIDRFRTALEACGVSTEPWWDHQLDLCMIGMMAAFGWEKALGDPGELAWWQDRVVRAAERCGLPLSG